MRLKQYLAGVLALTLALTLTACGGGDNSSSSSDSEPSDVSSSVPDEEPSQAPVEGDPYTAKVQGYGGEFEVTVILDGDKIAAVQVGENTETAGIGTEAIEKLPGQIVEAQSISVDSISGATVTSDAILAGVADCLTQAGKDPAAYQAGGEEEGEPVDALTPNTPVDPASSAPDALVEAEGEAKVSPPTDATGDDELVAE